MRTTITRTEHLQLLGLTTIMQQHQAAVDQAIAAADQLLDATSVDYFPWDELADGSRDLAWALELEKITVVPDPEPEVDPAAAERGRSLLAIKANVDAIREGVERKLANPRVEFDPQQLRDGLEQVSQMLQDQADGGADRRVGPDGGSPVTDEDAVEVRASLGDDDAQG